jgi:hypothetical protein
MKKGLAVLLSIALASACSARPRDVTGGSSRGRGAGVTADAGVPRVPPPPPPPEPAKTIGAKPRVVARATSRVLGVDDENVYYGDQADDGVFALPKTGGEPVRLARRAPVAGTLTIEGDVLVWIASPGDAVLQVSAHGGPVTTLRDKGIFSDVTAYGGEVFVAEVVSSGGTLTRIAGTAATKIAALDVPARALAADASSVFVVTATKILKTPHGRGAAETIFTGEGLDYPEVDDTSLYFVATVERGERVLLKLPKSGGAPTILARNVRQAPLEIAGPEIFYFDAERPQLRAVPIAGGAVRILAEDEILARPNQIEADATTVFVAVEDGAIVALPRR